MITLPGLIDPHVHLRTPGQSQKEDFYTGTAAALAGGFTTIIDMPNNLDPITTEKKLKQKKEIAEKQIVCDLGFHFGSLGENLEELEKVRDQVVGIKLYLSLTTGGFIVPKEAVENVFMHWPKDKVILVHAEDEMLDHVISLVKKHGNKTHICHVGQKTELIKIMEAKKEKLPLSCGVTPHYLFLTREDGEKLGTFGKMKPLLQSKEDQDFIWKHLSSIDLVESDHAPHTKEEKEVAFADAPYGVPGLETTLPLLLTAVSDNKLTLDDVKRLCHDNAAKIFGIETNPNTYIEVDENKEWTVENDKLFTKCKWSPFNGWKMKGKVKRVILRGTKVFEDGKILVEPGFGKII